MSTACLRRIVVLSQSKARPTIYTSGVGTWGELKSSMRREFNELDKMRATVRETRNDLHSDGAILPEGDFSIYLTPKQMKAGGIDMVELLRSLRDKWTNAIDELIDEVEDGEYTTEEEDDFDEEEEDSVMTCEDKKILEELKRENG